MAKKNQTMPKSFEEGMRELEQILSDIERGEMGVEESLVRYERGAFLIQHCRGVLNKAQTQIEILAKTPLSGEPMAVDDGGPSNLANADVGDNEEG